MNRRKIVLAVIFCMVVFFSVSPIMAVPAAPVTHTLEGENGIKFTARLWGDEFSHGWETTEGYSIILNETTKDWVYAVHDTDGNLAPSENVVGTDSSPADVPMRIRPVGKAQEKILASQVKQAPAVADKVVPATGTANIPVILINFNDRSTIYTPATFNTLLFGTATTSMKAYYEEVSYGKFSISSGPSGVAGWYTTANAHDYYGYDYSGVEANDDWVGTLAREAVVAADPSFDYAPYDNDNDCYVDNVNIIHQGTGQEASGTTTDIWSRSSNFNSLYQLGYSNGPEYSTNDPCPAGGYIKVNAFVIQPETLPTIFGGPQQTIGVFAHEFGHALGLPDLYDTTTASEGVGDWSLMGSGNWNKISVSGDTPAHLDAWSKSKLGWVAPVQVSESAITQIKEAEYNSEAYQLLNNPNSVNDWTRTGTGKGEYFLVENRRKTGFDAALPGEGLLIWHIDESRGNNNVKSHKLVDLEEADGLNHLDFNNTNRGDAFDPWYYKASGFIATSNPNSHFYNGSDSGVRVTTIGASGTTMTATLEVPDQTIAASTAKIGVFRPSTHLFYRDYNGNGLWDGAVIDRVSGFGISEDIPVSGDWNMDGRSEIGVFRPSTHLFYRDYNGNGLWDGAVIDQVSSFGISEDIPVSGDWNMDGRTEIGVFRPSTHLFYRDYNGNGLWDGAVIDRVSGFGITEDIPVSGDWNADARTEIGVFRPSTHLFYRDYNGNGLWDGAVTDRVSGFGITGDIPVFGTWV